jgi:glutamine amidotransferase
VRYSTEGRSRTLFVSADAHALKQLHPENPRLQLLRDEDRLVVSEPLLDLPGAWHEFPEASALTVQPDGEHEQRPFKPSPPGS